MSVSPKVTSATVGASVTQLVLGIVGPHLFPHGMPADVQYLIGAVVTAVVTFAAGYIARHDAALVTKVEADVAKAETAYSQVRQAVVAEAAAVPPVAQPLPVARPLGQ